MRIFAFNIVPWEAKVVNLNTNPQGETLQVLFSKGASKAPFMTLQSLGTDGNPIDTVRVTVSSDGRIGLMHLELDQESPDEQRTEQ
jgi:hypothetical protein